MSQDLPREHAGDSPRPLATALTCFAGVLAAVIRVVPHPANVSAMGALGLYGGARLRAWQAYVLPIALMVGSDLALWTLTFDRQYSPLHISRAYVYASFLLYVWIGRQLQNRVSISWYVGASLIGSVQFFLVTNFFYWLLESEYTRDLSGLLTCYAAALPFFGNSAAVDVHAFCVGNIRYGAIYLALGDLFFTGLLFGLHAVLARVAYPAERVGGDLQPARS